jgi:NADH dehydrogenase
MVGAEVCRLLSEQKQPYRVLVRPTSNPDKVAALKEIAAEAIEGDVRFPDTLKHACEGVKTVICTISAMPFSYMPGENDIETVDRDGVKALIDAAREAGVKRFIFTSFSNNMDLDFPLCNAKREVENYLMDSGMTYTILRPSYFMEVWLSPAVGFDAANAKAQIYGAGDQPVSWISFKDVAKFAVEAISNPAAENAVLELGGVEAISPNDVIERYQKKTGQTFEINHVPIEALMQQYAGVEDPMQKSFTGLMICLANGDPIDMSRVCQEFPIEMTLLDDFISVA